MIVIFNLNEDQKKIAVKLIKSLYEIIIKKDASLIEINPLIITKSRELICLDAKMNFDDNAIFRSNFFNIHTALCAGDKSYF